MLTASDLDRLVRRVWPVAEALGLVAPPVHFEVVSQDAIAALASNQGMPVRYAHWSFGKAYQRLKTAHDFRLTQIYELVINSEPAYAFVDRQSTPAQVLMIVAHVLGHVDFFRHNRLYRETPRDMVGRMAHHRRRLDDYRRQYGLDAVESLVDAAQVLTDFIGDSTRAYPPGRQDGDVLGYIVQSAPRLKDWERDVLSLLWTEARYFWPQQLTKVANEGYATFWHSAIMRQMALDVQEAWETARLQAQIVAVTPPQLNPYRLGYLLFQKAYAQGGWETLFLARDLYDDVGLVRAWLDDADAEEAGLALYQEREGDPQPHFAPGVTVKAQLQRDLDHAGIPRLVVDRTLTRPDHLYLRHLHDGRDLDFAELPYALKSVAERIWRGSVSIFTVRQRVARIVTHNGQQWADEVV